MANPNAISNFRADGPAGLIRLEDEAYGVPISQEIEDHSGHDVFWAVSTRHWSVFRIVASLLRVWATRRRSAVAAPKNFSRSLAKG